MSRNILFITPALSKSGAETQLVKLAAFVQSKGNKVLVLSLLPEVDCQIDMKAAGLEALFLKSWRSHFFSNLRHLMQIVKDFKPDLVIAFMFIAIIFARLLKLYFHFPLISSVRAAEIPAKWYVPFVVTSRLDDLVVFNSITVKQHFERRRMVRRRGVVINNAITIPSEVVDPESTSHKPFHWVCIAHFRSEKDFLTLFRAIALIKKRHFKLDIIGNLFNQTWPFNVIDELNIADKVNLLGFKANATDYLKEADAFVVSSFTESMPNVILEAMAYQKPIIATAVGGIPHLIKASKSGLCFKQGDAQELASRMCQMMELAKSGRSELAINGRRYVEEKFSEKKVMDRWLNVINQHQRGQRNGKQHISYQSLPSASGL